MKIQLEAIKPDANSSFHLMLNPRLNDFFFWHFHPEFELTYIEGANGNRSVGSHISQYAGSDLVFIGSNIPHLKSQCAMAGPAVVPALEPRGVLARPRCRTGPQ